LAAALLLLIGVLTVGISDLAAVFVATGKAQTAADSSALAAVQEMALPTGVAPRQAAMEVALRNGAVLSECDCSGGDEAAFVTVTVSVGSLTFLPGQHYVHASARAVVDSPSATPSPTESPP
jgi:hypothetical protein